MFPPEQPLNIRDATAADAGPIAHVHVVAWRETYAGLMPATILDRLDEAARRRYWSSVLEGTDRRTCVFVAEDASGVCGFACGGPQRSSRTDFSSELYAIYVLKKVQGRGAGRALFEAVTRALSSQGHVGMMLWVLDGNPACGFYEAMGGRRIDVRTEAFGDAVLREIAYGFDDLRNCGPKAKPS